MLLRVWDGTKIYMYVCFLYIMLMYMTIHFFIHVGMDAGALHRADCHASCHFSELKSLGYRSLMRLIQSVSVTLVNTVVDYESRFYYLMLLL